MSNLPSLKPLPPRLLDLELIRAEQARRKLSRFLEFAWPQIEPGKPFATNWHIEAICDHLQAVTEGHIRNLLINVPPRSLKSVICSVAWPAWEWARDPTVKWLFASYAQVLSTRDSVKCRRLIESPWYRQRWGDQFALASDQNQKMRYENNRGGYRISTSVGGTATGDGGNRRVIDDPHNATDVVAISDTTRESDVLWYKETWSTRMIEPITDTSTVIMQRLHERDLSGYMLAEELDLVHLCLPMRYEPKTMVWVGGNPSEIDTKAKTNPLGFVDPRNEEGELLHPIRVPEEEVKKLEKRLGSFGTAGQLQQRPSPRGGAIFKRADWQFWKALPQLDELVLSVDCAFKDVKTSDLVAIQAWGRKGADKYLVYRFAERIGFGATCQAIRTVKAKFPKAIAVLIEDKANGPAVIETLKGEIAGVIPINPEGGKVTRAYAMQPEHEAGNVYLPDPSVDPEIETFIGTCAAFPNVTHDDEVDAMTQAVNWFRTRERSHGLLNYYRSAAEQTAAAGNQEKVA